LTNAATGEKVGAPTPSDGTGKFYFDLMQVPVELVLTARAGGFVTYSDMITVSDDARLEVDIALVAGDEVAPGVNFIDPEDGATVTSELLVVSGIVGGLDPVEVTVNDVKAELPGGGRFSAEIKLAMGANTITAIAVGADGVQKSGRITVTRGEASGAIPQLDASTSQVRGGCASAPGSLLLVGALALLIPLARRRRT
jgi:hypothetical protein